MAFGFFLAVATLVFLALYVISRAVSSDLKRGLGLYPPAHPSSPSAAPPAGISRPLIITFLGWAGVVHGALWGLFWASILAGIGTLQSARSGHSPSDWFEGAWMFALMPMAIGAGTIRPARRLMALSPGGHQALRQAIIPAAFTIVIAAGFSAFRLMAVFGAIVGDRGGWTSPQAAQAYLWVLLWMVLAALIVILSTIITYGLQSEEVRRLFPETRTAPQPSPSL